MIDVGRWVCLVWCGFYCQVEFNRCSRVSGIVRFIVRIVFIFIQYKTQKILCVLNKFFAICGVYACVTKHGYRCPSPAGVYSVSDGAGIDFVEYMCYKSVRFYNSLEQTVIVDSGERNRAIW